MKQITFFIATLLFSASAFSQDVIVYKSNGEAVKYSSSEISNITFTPTDESGGNQETGKINGYEYVNLGLPSGLLWATCNIGANTPEGYGDYYMWGCIESCTNSEETNNDKTNSQDISDFSGNPTYDAARAIWGSSWRIPTSVEFQELIDYCTWTWTTRNGINGYLVIGQNGSSIFLPAAGQHYVWTTKQGENGLYWSSTPSALPVALYANILFFDASSHNAASGSRTFGYPIRPVSGGEHVEDPYVLAPESLNFDATASTQSVSISSNSDWTATSSASWLTVYPSNGSKDGNITVMVSANTSSSTRTATITLTAGTTTTSISVIQSAGELVGDLESLVTVALTGISTTLTSSGVYYGRTYTVTNNSDVTIQLVSIGTSSSTVDFSQSLSAHSTASKTLYFKYNITPTIYVKFTYGGKEYTINN